MEFREITVDELDFVSAICLDPSVSRREAMREHMENRLNWLRKMMSQELKIIVALENPKPEVLHCPWAGNIRHADLAVKGKVPKGLIEYLPIEMALEPVKGENSLFINCVWILPPFWKTGVAKGLMQLFIEEARKWGGATVLAYEGDKWFGTSLKYMPSSFFKKFGFKEVSRDGTRVLLHLDLGARKSPMLVSPKRRVIGEKGETVIDVFCNSQCPWCGRMVDKISRNIRKYSDVTLNVINTDRRDVIEQFGVSRGVFINGEPVIKRMASWKEIKSALNKFTNRNVDS
ncbi:MAG: GNAT family N-acetyltransferase [Candidatus Bathyarchaeota archaeon]|nr:GNAT family N-acetyltransferase [Candidatus Bathyarchaeota archaeon]